MCKEHGVSAPHGRFDGDHDREQRCLECDDKHLRERGRDCGLSEFLDEIDARLVPAFK
jgi:hypothetical protein